ncbi:hypothetical protein Pmani_035910 [Petrolisthes manimaculis]|uniref:Uncharacterized protein n=1 Tax=Petrolisthes manimaculis TaxID=1843537 RepID=A0AAE1TN80_9EUCA|nr:hypothetical protein Pmani_035910 [Petrolisthes manimaculis]
MVEDWRREDKEVGGRKGKTGRRTDRHLSPTLLSHFPPPFASSPPASSPPASSPPASFPPPLLHLPSLHLPSLHLPPLHLPSGDPQYRYFCLESGRRTLKFLITG